MEPLTARKLKISLIFLKSIFHFYFEIPPVSGLYWPQSARARPSTCAWVCRTCSRGRTWRSFSGVRSPTTQSKSFPCPPEGRGAAEQRNEGKRTQDGKNSRVQMWRATVGNRTCVYWKLRLWRDDPCGDAPMWNYTKYTKTNSLQALNLLGNKHSSDFNTQGQENPRLNCK